MEDCFNVSEMDSADNLNDGSYNTTVGFFNFKSAQGLVFLRTGI